MGYPYALLMNPPKPTYPEYAAVVTRARELTPAFVNPANLWPERPVVYRRGTDWCTAVLGRPYETSGRITVHEQYLLIAADEAGIDPPLPGWIVEGRAEDARIRAEREQQLAAARQRELDRWTAALAETDTRQLLEVHFGSRARARGHVSEPLQHVVPRAEVYSGTGRVRVHRAGRGLCESPNRARPLALDGRAKDGTPATCVNCLRLTALVRTTRRPTNQLP